MLYTHSYRVRFYHTFTLIFLVVDKFGVLVYFAVSCNLQQKWSNTKIRRRRRRLKIRNWAMVFSTNLCLFGCVIVSSIVLLNNSVLIFANAKSNVNRLHEATVGRDAGASLPHRRYARDDNDRTKILAMMEADETTTAVTSKQRLNDDRLIFDPPAGFGGTTATTAARPHQPIKSNSTMQAAFEVDGEYNFA